MSKDPIFAKLAKKEQDFTSTEFFAPVFSNKVRVNMEGVLVDYKPQPENYRGWGIFRVAGKNIAQYARDANLVEIAGYLSVFPRTSFIVVDIEEIPVGISSSEDGHYTLNPTQFFLADSIELFDQVYVRFDGGNYIFEQKIARENMKAAQLRQNLENKVSPKNLDFSGLTKFDQIAYSLVFELRKQKELQSTEGRVRSAVEKGGGKFRSYKKVSGNISVTYEVRGEVFTSTVRDNLSLVSAGICLSGTDSQHDLQSLMSVIDEGIEKGLIYRW